MRQGPCPKCGSAEIVRDIKSIHGASDLRSPGMWISVDPEPYKWIFKEIGYSSLMACMCSQCGYMELYAEKPKEIAKAAALAAKNK